MGNVGSPCGKDKGIMVGREGGGGDWSGRMRQAMRLMQRDISWVNVKYSGDGVNVKERGDGVNAN